MYYTDLINKIVTSPQGRRALSRVTHKYGDAAVILNFFQAMGYELDVYTAEFNSIAIETVPNTAESSIEKWEDMVGLDHDESYSLEQRRKRVIDKMTIRHPLNPKRLEEIVSGITGYRVEIDEYAGKNRFKVTIYGNPTLDRLFKAIRTLRRIKQAHLAIDMNESQTHNMSYYYGIAESRVRESANECETPNLNRSFLADAMGIIIMDARGHQLAARAASGTHVTKVNRTENAGIYYGAVHQTVCRQTIECETPHFD